MTESGKELINHTRKLIETIEEILKSYKGKQSQLTKNLTIILQHQSNLIDNEILYDDYLLASVQVGLNKFFDFYIGDWTVKELTEQYSNDIIGCINNIVLMSASILQKHPNKRIKKKRCGRHEDGACVISQMSRRDDSKKDRVYNGWPLLPQRFLRDFLYSPHPHSLTENMSLFRIYEKNKGNKMGNYWLLHDPRSPFMNWTPDGKRYWRSLSAVRKEWNEDHHLAIFKSPSNLKVWVGIAASQLALKYDNEGKPSIPPEHCILGGGGIQVWISTSDLNEPIKVCPLKRNKKI